MKQRNAVGVPARLTARMRRCLILRQGATPPETPVPLSLRFDVPDRQGPVKGSQAAQKQRALDRSLPIRKTTEMRERGPLGPVAWFCLPLVGPENVDCSSRE